MEGSLKELAEYRLERANEMLSASESNLEIGQYKTNARKGFDSSKHSGVIAFFTKEYLKTEILDRSLSLIIKESSLCREKSDYDDFYVASRIEAEEQIKNAKYFVQKIEEYISAMDK